MKKLLDSSIIKGLLLSSFGITGPGPIYAFPDAVIEEEQKNSEEFKFTYRDYTQISIKNLSLLMDDTKPTESDQISDMQYFAILPYPDYKVTALTFFRYIELKQTKKFVPTVFSIMVDETKRSFLYNNINEIKSLIFDLFSKLEDVIIDEFKPLEDVELFFVDLLKALIELEKNPSIPITSERKLKMIFFGLDAAGKTSFLLTVDRKFSRLIGLKPTRGENISTIEALGATISLWDLGGQKKFRERYISKPDIYLYEADLLFYFIDINARDRFDESIQYLQNIKKMLAKFEQETPIIYILSKADEDIVDTKKIQENIIDVKGRLAKITENEKLDLHITSIFSIFSILRAFSSGISKLSPNRDLIKHNLKNFSIKNELLLTLLLSENGLVVADYYAEEMPFLSEFDGSNKLALEVEKIRDIFEISAPQFAMLYKIFSKFRTLKEKEAIFKIAKSVVLFKQAIINEQKMYILTLIDDEKKKNGLIEALPEFLNKNSALLMRFIS